jgi:hypothetical protein
MYCYFIYNNLKVNPFLLYDQPYPGFELLSWETHSWTPGTLWDLGLDAGFTRLGNGVVYGQIWVAKDLSKIDELEDVLGVYRGLREPVQVEVSLQVDPPLIEHIKATTFQLSKISSEYTIVNDGKWLIKRDNIIK